MNYSYELNHNAPSLDYIKGFLDSINKKILEQKYFYCNTLCSYNWIHLVNDINHYQLADLARRMFESYLEQLFKKIDDRNISVVSLGVGDGYNDKQLISYLLNNGADSVKYYPYDISHELITYANRQIHSLPHSNKVQTIAIEDDFKNISSYRKKFNSDSNIKLFCLLGSTISNFKETELLMSIKEVMSDDDFLLIGADCSLDVTSEARVRNHSKDSDRGLNFLFGPINSLLSYIRIPELEFNNLSFDISDQFIKSIYSLNPSVLKLSQSPYIESDMSHYGEVSTIEYSLSTIDKILNFSHKYKTRTIDTIVR